MTQTRLPSTEFTQTYLGNSQEQQSLRQLLENAGQQQNVLEVFLAPQDRGKARIYAKSESGRSVGIIKDRHWSLREGDIFETISGTYLHIHLKPLEVMVLRRVMPTGLEQDQRDSFSAFDWFRLGHHLGNLHYPVSVEEDSILVQFSGDRERLLTMLKPFDLSALSISFEQRAMASMDSISTHAHSDNLQLSHSES